MKSANFQKKFRRELKLELKKRSLKNLNYSPRAFAKYIKISPSLLSGILSGRLPLTEKTYSKIKDILSLYVLREGTPFDLFKITINICNLRITLLNTFLGWNLRLLNFFIILTVLMTVCACGKIWGSITWFNSSCSVPMSLSAVTPVYPLNGANWMDYVHVATYSLGPWGQPDSACLGTETHFADCVHGGEIRKVALPGISSCSGLSATDSLNAFTWVCQVVGGQAIFYSSGLQRKTGAHNLLSISGWLPNSVSVFQGSCPVGQTPSTVWYSNTVIPLTGAYDNHISGSGVVVLNDAPGSVYVLDTSRDTDGYNLNLDKQALVLLNGSTLRYTGNAANNINSGNGKTVGANAISVIGSGSQKYDWVEGTFNASPSVGTTATISGELAFTNFTTIRASTFENAQLQMISIKNCYFKNITVFGSTASGFVVLNNSTGIFASDIYAYNNLGSGIDIDSSNASPQDYGENLYASYNSNVGVYLPAKHSVFKNIYAFNNYGNAGFAVGSNNSIVVGAIETGTNTFGGVEDGGTQNTLLNITSVNNNTSGLYLTAASNQGTYANVLVANNSSVGIYLHGATNQRFYDVASVDNQAYGIEADTGSTGNDFRSYVLDGNNPTKNCFLNAAGASPGFVDPTCTSGGGSGAGTEGSGGSTANWGGGGNLSTALLHVGKTSASSFFGQVTQTDSANSTNTNGTNAFSVNLDWFNFSYPFRGWGKNGGAYPNATDIGVCNAGTCRIWDFRLLASDSVFRNVTNDGSTQNSSFTSGTTCPQAVNGNTTAQDQQGNTFLINAVEITYDAIHNPNGNNNGLCESGEGCIYSPNIGAYQGEGDPFSQGTCTFQNGTISNVQMYAYPQNGG